MDALACLLLSCASALLGFWLALDSDGDEPADDREWTR